MPDPVHDLPSLPTPTAPACERDNKDTSPPVDSVRLFAGRREVRILHNGSVYRLKHTALGKLILTK